MSDKIDVSATVKVSDQASGPLGAIRGKLGAMAQQARATGAAVGNALNKGSFGGATKQIGGLTSAFGRLKGAIMPIGALLGVAIGGASIAAAAAGLHSFVGEATGLAKMAPILGTTVEQLGALRYAASRAGIGAEEFDNALKKANLNLGKAAREGAGKNSLASLMNRLKISMRDASGEVRPAADILRDFAGAMGRQTSATTKAEMAVALFGKTGQEMVKLLGAGTPAFDAWIARAMDLGVITTEQAEVAKRFADAQRQVRESLSAVGRSINGLLLPALTPLVERFAAFVDANRVPVINAISAAFKGLGTALNMLPWRAMGDAARAAFGFIDRMVKQFIGWDVVIAAFAGVLSLVLVKALLGLGTVLVGLTAKFALFTLALLSNPIVLAAAAIGIAAYLIYKNWDKVAAFFDETWKDAKKAFDDAKAWLTSWLPDFSDEGIKEKWSSLGTFFGGVWQDTKATFDPVLGWLSEKTGGFVPDSIETAWTRLSGFFSTLWATTGTNFDRGLAELNRLTGGFVPASIEEAWGRLKTFFKTLWDEIAGIFKWAWDNSIGPIVDTIGKGISKVTSWLPSFSGWGKATEPAQPAASAQASTARVAAAVPKPAGVAALPGPAPGQMVRAATGAGATGPVTARLEGEVKVDIRFANAPPGMSFETRDSGQVRSTGNVGYSLAPA